MGFIAFEKKPDCRDQACGDQESKERLGPGSQHGGGAEHHPSQDEDEKNLVGEVSGRVEKNARCAPAGAGQAHADGEDSRATCPRLWGLGRHANSAGQARTWRPIPE